MFVENFMAIHQVAVEIFELSILSAVLLAWIKHISGDVCFGVYYCRTLRLGSWLKPSCGY